MAASRRFFPPVFIRPGEVVTRLEAEGVDVIVRFHDMRRVAELERAIFSLVGQEYRPLRILLALQRFSSDDEASLLERLGPLLSLPDAPALTVLRYQEPEPLDARSSLVNLGFAAADAAYVALLDYDDVLYPEAYRLLTDRARASGAGIAFAGITVKLIDLQESFVYPTARVEPFCGSTLTDLFRSNFCPIHSFLVDRRQVSSDQLRFEPTQTIEEDYEFLLRICATIPSDFSLVRTHIGEYYYKSDQSNTVAGKGEISAELRSRIEGAHMMNEARRRLTTLAPAVQRQLGLQDVRPSLTIRAYLDLSQSAGAADTRGT